MRSGQRGWDRKTLDVHMHLMEAFTTLYECSGKDVHRRKLLEDIDLLVKGLSILFTRPEFPSFSTTGVLHPQIKFNIVWGLGQVL
ncbi:MAG: hypothetical protein MZV63_36535 [Marinilabiliales bacterium]|nr:hypothetical protein [Marinilabiliales bacterium]